MASILIGGIVVLCIRCITKYDTAWNRSFCMGERVVIAGAIMAESVLISIIMCALQDNRTVIPIRIVNPIMIVLLSVLAGALLFACITDMLCTQVYRFTWWLAWGSGLLMIVLQICDGAMKVTELVSLLVFGVLQEGLFAKMYGRADCHAFLACAMAEGAFGMGLKEFLIHMALSFAILTVVQAFRKNINSKGNLKCPVPFLPYITAGFWVLMLAEA